MHVAEVLPTSALPVFSLPPRCIGNLLHGLLSSRTAHRLHGGESAKDSSDGCRSTYRAGHRRTGPFVPDIHHMRLQSCGVSDVDQMSQLEDRSGVMKRFPSSKPSVSYDGLLLCWKMVVGILSEGCRGKVLALGFSVAVPVVALGSIIMAMGQIGLSSKTIAFET